MAEIKFRRNYKNKLLNVLQGEVVYAVDTNEWGLGLSDGSVVWRDHWIRFEPAYHQGEGQPDSDFGEVGFYYFDEVAKTVYQKYDGGWFPIRYPLSQGYFNQTFLRKGEILDYGDYSQVIKKDGSVKVRVGYAPNDPEDALTVEFVESQTPFLRTDGSTQMDTGYVGEGNGVVVKGQEILYKLPTEDPRIAGVLWNRNGVVRVSFGDVSVIRYYTTEELHFAEYDETFSIVNTETVQSNGTYVEYTGDWGLDYMFDAGSVTKIEVLNYGNRTSWVLMANVCTNMTEFVVSATDESKVTDFRYAWCACSSLTSFPQLDVSSGTNFDSAWIGCSSLTPFPELDVSSGTNFSGAWNGCSSLTSFPELDVSSGINFGAAWGGCSSLTSFPQLDVSQGTDFEGAWRECSSLTSFPQLDVSQGTTFENAWNNCSSLTSFPQLDVSQGTTFYFAWYRCSSLTSFPELDVSSGTHFGAAWYECSSLSSFPLLDVSSGTNFGWAWHKCDSLTSFPELDVSSGTDFGYTWEHCTSLTSFPQLDVSSGTNFRWAWEQCSSLTSFPQLDVSSGTDFSAAWHECSKLPECPLNYLNIPSGADTSNACNNCCTE